MAVVVLSESETRSEILKGFDKFSAENIFNQDSLLADNKNIFSDYFQKFLYMNFGEYHRKIILPMISKNLIGFEGLSAGSANIALRIIEQTAPQYLRISRNKKVRDIKKEIQKSSEAWIQRIKKESFRCTESDLTKILRQEIDNDEIIEIVNRVLAISSINTVIDVKRSNREKTRIKLLEGYNFNIPIDRSILHDGRKVIKKNVNCYVIDGMIESLSEIHHLLTQAAENKEPYVLFLRSMSPEVRNVIFMNLKRGTIDLTPICVGFDEKTINILNDISICTGSDLISSLTGDLISASTRREPNKINKIEISEKGVVLYSDSDKFKIRNHIKYLRDKSENLLETETPLRSIFDQRIRSLISEKIQIEIGLDLVRKDPITLAKIDKFFRLMRAVVNFGAFRCDRFEEFSKSPLDACMVDLLKNSGHLYSTSSLCYAIKASSSMLESIISIGISIVDDS